MTTQIIEKMEMKTILGLNKINEDMRKLLFKQGFDVPEEIRDLMSKLGLRIEKELKK